MRLPIKGAIDCDLHPAAPSIKALMPYLDDFWREHLAERYIDQSPFTLMSYAPNLPQSARPDWRPAKGSPGADLDTVRAQALDPFGTRFAIANVLHGVVALFNADMAAALCKAVNDWMAREWLDREPRLRASILVAPQDAELAAAEIERCAPDERFVQVLLLVMGDRPLGHRTYWPIYRAAERHGLPIGIHAGSTFRRAPTGSGWPSYHLEDSVLQGPAFEDTLVSFLAEGVFQKFPDTRLVLMESGFTWLPPLLWRTNKSWRGVRTEVPWIDRAPADIIRDHVRLSLQPADVPNADVLNRIMDHLRSDEVIVFSTDYPHWQFDGEEVLPDGLADATVRKILIDNPLATYPRLRTAHAAVKSAEQQPAAMRKEMAP
jgi:predicted TIM-barrel fold metal-dependent hydrolase